MQGSVRTRQAGSRGLPVAPPGSASAVLGGGSVPRAADVDVGRPRPRWPIRARPGRFTPEVN
jgi:hypothetical protein